jgi:LAGLIDADG DNA endonuclease family
MDDGQEVKRGGVTLCTDNFSYEEVLLLKSVLETNYKITSTIHKK